MLEGMGLPARSFDFESPDVDRASEHEQQQPERDMWWLIATIVALMLAASFIVDRLAHRL